MERANTAMKRVRLLVLVGIASLVLVCMVGCGGNPADDPNRTNYEGVSIILPDGWSASESSGNLEITPAEKAGTDASMQGMHFEYAVQQGNEESSLENILKSTLRSLAGSSYDVSDANITTKTIDGAVTETAKAGVTVPVPGTSMKVNTDLVLFGAVAGDGVTILYFQTRGDDYTADINGILDSVRIINE